MNQELPLIARARVHHDRIAIRADGRDHRYADLLAASERIAAALLGCESDLSEARVAFMLPAGFDYLAVQWGIWRAGGIAVPLSLSGTVPELEHTLSDSGASRLIAPRGLEEKLSPLSKKLGCALLAVEDLEPAAASVPRIDPCRRAMILYTSGTTSKPKGVVTTHDNIRAQIESLVTAWEWRADDRIPLFLPMHHVHGIINVACCALWSGAMIEAFPRFDAELILGRVAECAYTVFMAVPTIYVKLIELLDSRPDAAVMTGFGAMRLMVSGSAALPPSVHRKWTDLTGQCLLERYGMTETAMMISNPLHGERRSGAVGRPLSGVEVRLMTESGKLIEHEGEPGEIQARGAGVFREYWNLPQVTEASFDDGWFRTGDMAVLEDGYYRILGRLSVDIIKSGGYKLSALEIEAALLEHPAIRECAVVGLDDETWGEMVAAAVVLEESGSAMNLADLRRWGKDRLSSYKLPRELLVLPQLPRNAMGKVTKPTVGDLFRMPPVGGK